MKMIMLDWDGTLNNSISKINHCCQFAAHKLGFDIDFEDVRKVLGKPFNLSGEKLCPGHGSEYREIYLKEYFGMPEAPMYEGAKETLFELKKNYKLSLVTGKPRQATFDCMKANNFENIFDYIVCCEDTTKFKPDPDPLLKAVDYFKIKLNETVYIGDSENDILSSKAANVPVIIVTWGALHRDEAEKYEADYIADTWEELLDICKKL